MTTGTMSERLARFAHSLRPDGIPSDVAHVAKLHLLDTLGVCLAASALGPGEPVGRLAGQAAAGGSTVAGWSRPLAAHDAALLNGILAHSLEFDDTHTPSVIHGGAVVIPTALAVAEERHAPGDELVRAFVVGFEVLIRLGLAAPGAFQARGFQTTAICGPFAAALMSGLMMGLSEEELVAALGIAGSQPGGIFEYLSDGSSVKQLHQGWASYAGIAAARLSHAGFTGPRTVLEGRFGVYRTYADTVPRADVLDDLGSAWETLNLSIKPYPCCHFNHAFIDGALQLRPDITDPGQVSVIHCRIPEPAVAIVCEPADRKKAPGSGYEAKFSLPYAVAAALVDGEVSHRSFTDDAASRRSVTELAAKVEYQPVNDLGYPRNLAGELEIVLNDGRSAKVSVPHHLGGPDRPLADLDVITKFVDNAASVVEAGWARSFADRVLSVDSLPDVAELGGELRAAAGSRSTVS